MVNDILHGYDRMCIKAVLLLDLFQSTDLAAQSLLHTVQGYHQTDDFHICSSSYLRYRLFHRLAGSSNIFDHNNSVAVLQSTSQKASFICAVILLFLTVGAIADLLAV